MKEFKGTWSYDCDCDVMWDGEDESYREYFTVHDEKGREVAWCDTEYHAKLIVALPELLEELIKLRNYLDDVAQSIDAQRFIDSADLIISKALGETK